MALAGKLVASHSSVQCSSAVHSPRGPALGSISLTLWRRGGRLLAGSNVGRANKPGPVPAQSFLKNSPSVPQAFERLYGTIQAASPTQHYLVVRNVLCRRQATLISEDRVS